MYKFQHYFPFFLPVIESLKHILNTCTHFHFICLLHPFPKPHPDPCPLHRTPSEPTCRCTSVLSAMRTTSDRSGWSTTRSSWNVDIFHEEDLGSTSPLALHRSNRVAAAPPRPGHRPAERDRRQLTRQLSREARNVPVHQPPALKAVTLPSPWIARWQAWMVQARQLLWQLLPLILNRPLEAVPPSKVASKLRP